VKEVKKVKEKMALFSKITGLAAPLKQYQQVEQTATSLRLPAQLTLSEYYPTTINHHYATIS
jgi:hypothetical protein